MSEITPLTLVVTDEGEESQTHEFRVPNVTLGKMASNLLHPDSTYLSRQHGVFHFVESRWYYRDLGSLNGTRVSSNGFEYLIHQQGSTVAPEPVLLRGGEVLLVGDTLRIEVHLPGVEMATHHVEAESNPYAAMTMIVDHNDDDDLHQLYESVRQVSMCTDEDAVLSVIAEVAFRAIPRLTHMFVFERQPRESEGGESLWNARWSRARDGHSDRAWCFSRTLLEQTEASGHSQLFYADQPMGVSTGSLVLSEIASAVCVPLTGVQGNIGVLQADCRRERARLEERDLHLLTLLSEQAGMVIDRLRTTENIRGMFEGFVKASVKAIESRDPSTAGHSERVANYCMRVIEGVNSITTGPFGEQWFNEDRRLTLRYAALLHDFGKIGVPSEVLLKKTKLSDRKIAEVENRFRVARMEIAARRNREKFEALWQDRTLAAGALRHFDERIHREQVALMEDLAWLHSLLGSGPIPEAALPRLKKLTECWPTVGEPLLRDDELQAMLSCGSRTLTSQEFAKIQEHASKTREYLTQIPWSCALKNVPEFAGNHHEKLDGGGYPRGLGEGQLPLDVRILTVCDIYDALTASDRPYRTAMAPDKALRILERDVQRGAVDGEVLSLFIETVLG